MSVTSRILYKLSRPVKQGNYAIVPDMKLMLRTCLVVVLVACFFFVGSIVHAQHSSSTNYQINESSFQVGGDIDSNSASYNARTSAGNIGVGDASSTNYNAVAGFITPSEEYLELNVTAGIADLGNLSDTTTGTANGTFYVRTYTASGYVVKTMSNTLTSEGGATITPMSSAGTSSAGTEQFGMNLVANTSPTTFGAAPAPQPDNTFAFGAAAAGYNTANNFKYTVTDTIALASKGIGQTNYTISYIANIGPITEAGTYTMVQDIVAIPTF